jgi:hypothetical protein
MTTKPSSKSGNLGGAHFSRSLSQVDQEIVRLCTICNVRILDPGVIQRVLHNDASVCGTPNEIAFKKLREILMMHYSLREQAVDTLGSQETVALMEQIVASLRERIGDRLGGTPGGKI